MPPAHLALRLHAERSWRAVVAALLVSFACALAGSPAGAAERRASIVAVFVDPVQSNLRLPAETGEVTDTILRADAESGMAVGLMSTAQGRYLRDQVLLDITQGTRQPRAVYETELLPLEVRRDGEGAQVVGWRRTAERARTASTTLQPGLLAEAAGGGAFVSSTTTLSSVAALAADRRGVIRAVSTGPVTTTARRALESLAQHSLVVVELPRGAAGRRTLADLVADRPTGAAVVAVHLPPTRPERSPVPLPAARFYGLTAIAVTDDVVGSPSMTSPTTRQQGLVASIDLAPTVLHHLSADVPRVMRGHPVEGADGDVRALENARRRWASIRGGGLEAVVRTTALLCAGVWIVFGIFVGVRRAGMVALRILGLGMLWIPAVVLLLSSARFSNVADEAQVAAMLATGAAALTARAVRWPAAAAVPALAGLVVVTVDLIRGGPLLTTSLLAPSITTGNRFYGVSNELEPLIPALGLVIVAAVAHRLRSRRALTATYAAVGVVIGIVVAAGRLGADVGGVATIAGAFTVAGFTATGHRPSLRLVVAAVAAAAMGMIGLVAADLLVGGDSHLSNNLSRVGSPGELLELVSRRYELAWSVLSQRRNLTQFLTAGAVVVFVARNRDSLLGRLPSRPWLATLTGTLGGGIAGAMANDSGPVLFVNAVVACAALAAYLSASPERGGLESAAGGAST